MDHIKFWLLMLFACYAVLGIIVGVQHVLGLHS